MFHTHITGQFLIVLHHLLVLLVDSQHFADTICSCLSLSGNRVMSSAHSDTHCAQRAFTVATCLKHNSAL